jgi:hypothetical protein
MGLFRFGLVCAGLFAVLEFLILPKLRFKARLERGPDVVGRVALMALLSFARTVALIGVASAAAVATLVLTLRVSGGGTTAQVGASIARVASWRDAAVAVGPWWSAFVLLVLVAVMGWLHRNRGRRRIDELFRRRLEEELERLKSEQAAGRWEDLPEDSAMEGFREQFDKLKAFDVGLEQKAGEEQGAAMPNRDLLAAIAAKRRELEGHFEVLRQAYQARDVRRRMTLELDPDQVAPPPPRTWGERVQTFFVSEGLLGTLSGSVRVAYWAGLALLALCLTGVQSGMLAHAAEGRLVELRDLQVRLAADEARAEWEKAAGAAATAAAQVPEPDDEEIADALAAHFEQAWASGGLWSPQAIRPSVSLVAHRVREQLLADYAARSDADSVRMHQPGTTAASKAEEQVLESVRFDRNPRPLPAGTSGRSLTRS